MTRQETIQLLMVISAAYPNYKVADKNVAVNLWQSMLEEYEYNVVMAAVKSFIATDKSGFAPSVGQVIDKIHLLMSSNKHEVSENEAWSIVSRALRNSTYNSKSEFDKLPDAIKKAVGSPNMLYQWATDENFNESVVSSNFMRSYREVAKRQREYDLLPTSVKQALKLDLDTKEKGAVLIGERV